MWNFSGLDIFLKRQILYLGWTVPCQIGENVVHKRQCVVFSCGFKFWDFVQVIPNYLEDLMQMLCHPLPIEWPLICHMDKLCCRNSSYSRLKFKRFIEPIRPIHKEPSSKSTMKGCTHRSWGYSIAEVFVRYMVSIQRWRQKTVWYQKIIWPEYSSMTAHSMPQVLEYQCYRLKYKWIETKLIIMEQFGPILRKRRKTMHSDIIIFII